jgi:hypothetical protein
VIILKLILEVSCAVKKCTDLFQKRCDINSVKLSGSATEELVAKIGYVVSCFVPQLVMQFINNSIVMIKRLKMTKLQIEKIRESII